MTVVGASRYYGGSVRSGSMMQSHLGQTHQTHANHRNKALKLIANNYCVCELNVEVTYRDKDKVITKKNIMDKIEVDGVNLETEEGRSLFFD